MLLIALITNVIMSCTKKDSDDILEYGNISGYVICPSGVQGIKVSLIDPIGYQPKQVAVTDADGLFDFSYIVAGDYCIQAEREGFNVDRVLVDGTRIYENQTFYISANQTTNIIFYLSPSSEYLNDELTVTDFYDNPIGNRIIIPKYTSAITIKLYNGTYQDVHWNLRHNCWISGYRDTVVGNYTGYTYHTFELFEDVTPSEGTLSPGNIVLITGRINPDIYTLDRFDDHPILRTLSLITQRSTHYTSSDIELYLPFMYE